MIGDVIKNMLCSDIPYDMLYYNVMFCYITHDMLCYITDDMLLYNT